MQRGDQMAYDVGVRQALVNSGIPNEQIGWDQNTGYVTVNGQNFMRPQKNIHGTTYTDQPSFNQALSAYNRSIQPTTQPTTQTVTQVPQVQNQVQQNYNNPMDAQISNLISSIMSQVNNRQQFDPYTSPEFAAQEARSQRAAQQGIRAAQESMGSAGFGRSTALGERAQNIQNDQEEYLRTQVIPSIIAQNEQRRQQELQNRMSLLAPLMSQQNVFDARNQFDRNFSLSEGQLTGNYMPPQAQQIIDNILELKRQAEMPGVAGEQLQNLSSQADVLRNQLSGMGIDPSFISADVDMNTASQNRLNAGIPTLAARDQQFSQDVTMAQLTGFMPDGTPTNAQQQQQLQNEWMVAEQTGQITPTLSQMYGIPAGTPTQSAKQFAQSLAIQQQNANTSRMSANQSAANARFNQNMELWKATGVAPEGIPGVKAGTQWSTSNPGPEQYQAQIVEGITQTEDLEEALDFLSFYAKDITSQLGVKGYEELRKSARDHFFDPSIKDETNLRNQAARLAQNDRAWLTASKEKQQELIQEYMDFLRGN